MKLTHTWVFYISLLSFCYSVSQENDNITINDSLNLKKEKSINLRVGFDLYRIILSRVSDDFDGFEIVGDFKVSEDFFIALELGSLDITKQVEQVNFTTNGNYFKLGFDYNMFENLEGMNNHITLGARIGSSRHDQTLNSYAILDRTRYWLGSSLPITNGFATGKRSDLNALWFEVVLNFKVQILKNIYTGISLRLNRLLSDEIPLNFDNIYIPGFNKKTQDNVFGAGFNYTLTYNFSLLSKKK
ncbi:MAG: DUF6048 family protein [Flavobacteriaceae bacterium]|tara:strand:- start:20542 stop:21273 length:732 start_codon:yes stop_codon:yes gene_type:complete